MKILKKGLFVILCIVLFIVVFAASVVTKIVNTIGGDMFSAFALQGESAVELLAEDEVTKELIDVRYIKSDGTIDSSRQIMLYRPTGVDGDLPLIYIPHYAAEENTADFVSYIRHGWAVAAPYEFKNDYNFVLETDDLVFNNAALYALRHMDGIDNQRIAIVGGSAGGYMCMMLNGLQMGNTAAIANAPIVNAYFNFHEYFPLCDEVNRNGGAFTFLMPIQGLVSKSFQPINAVIGDDFERWEAVSAISMARAYSNPVVIVHNTSDILVPLDQLTHQHVYQESDGTLPKSYSALLPSGYPGILSSTFEELADPDELTVNYLAFENYHVEGDLPYADTLITINVNDDGAPTAKGSHSNPTMTGSLNIFPYLEDMFGRTLAGTEKLIPKKLLLLLERYQGKSIALPAHEGVDDAVYGSLAVYQQEVIDELAVWIHNNDYDTMDAAVKSAIDTLPLEEQEAYMVAWNEIGEFIK